MPANFDRQSVLSCWQSLTAQEKRVALMIAYGNSVKETVAELTISERTLRTHLYSIFQKFNIDNRQRLVSWIWLAGIASLGNVVRLSAGMADEEFYSAWN